jgi:hypothetical protein
MLYPVAPPGTSVMLNPPDFIQSVPESVGVSYPTGGTVIGDNLYQHPGAVLFPTPQFPAPFLIGVFGGPIDTSNPNTSVYLWETGGGTVPTGEPGPLVMLGHWDGSVFNPFGKSVQADYQDTGVSFQLDMTYYLHSSIIALSDFQIPGTPILNAVMIEGVDVGPGPVRASSRVVAVAANTIPEPSSIVLLGTALAGLFGHCWSRNARQVRRSARSSAGSARICSSSHMSWRFSPSA